MDLIEVTGTISQLFPLELEGTGYIVQNILLSNVTPVKRNNSGIRSRVLLTTRVSQSEGPINFQLNKPITCKGIFVPGNSDILDTLHSSHGPNGFIRYDGKVYK